MSSNDERRMMPDVAAVRRNRPTRKELFTNADGQPLKINTEYMLEHFKHEGRLSVSDAIDIVREARKLLSDEPNLLRLKDPINICGDIHGQFFDLVRLLELGGTVGDSQYLFLGDYVDRGYFSCEVVLLLFAYKINFPDRIYMLRGNHESRSLTSSFSFKMECFKKYSKDLYEEFMTAFDCLPLAAVVNKQFFCVHGGLSPYIQRLDDILAIDRFREPPTHGSLCDLLWADPIEDKEENVGVMFERNTIRGCSYFFGFAAADKFLRDNKLLTVIRAHEVEDEGYKMYRKRPSTKFPSVITVFSAPNFNDQYRNEAAIIIMKDNRFNIKKFKCRPHPYWLPGFLDVFTWSLPFVAEKVIDMLLTIVSNLSTADDDEPSDGAAGARATASLWTKVRAVGRVHALHKKKREEFEQLVKDSETTLLPREEIPDGVIYEGKLGFERAREHAPASPTSSDPPSSLHRQSSLQRFFEDLSHKGVNVSNEERTQFLAKLTGKMAQGGVKVSDRESEGQTYESSCSGSDIVEFIVREMTVPRGEALGVGQQLMDAHFVYHVKHRSEFHDSDRVLYRFHMPSELETMTTPPAAPARPLEEQLREVQSSSKFNESELKKLRSIFKRLDVDQSGTIEISEFLRVPEIQVNPLAERLLSLFDSNRDNHVDFSEFIVGMENVAGFGSLNDKLKMLFQVYDVDADGWIDNCDLFKALKLMVANNLNDVQLQQIVDKTLLDSDINSDNRVDFEEFVRMVSSIGQNIDRQTMIRVDADPSEVA